MNGSRQCSKSAYGSDVEYAAASLSDHLLVDWFGDGKQAVNIRMDYFIPGSICSRGKVIAPVYRGVVYKNIESTPLLHDLSRHPLHSNAIGYGYFESQRASTKRLDAIEGLAGEVISRAIVECNVTPLASKYLADGGANTTRSPSNERTFSFKQKTHQLSLLLKNPLDDRERANVMIR